MLDVELRIARDAERLASDTNREGSLALDGLGQPPELCGELPR